MSVVLMELLHMRGRLSQVVFGAALWLQHRGERHGPTRRCQYSWNTTQALVKPVEPLPYLGRASDGLVSFAEYSFWVMLLTGAYVSEQLA